MGQGRSSICCRRGELCCGKICMFGHERSVCLILCYIHRHLFLTSHFLYVWFQIATLAYAIAFQNPSFWGYLWSVLYGVLVDWLLVGLAIASTTSHIANKYLRQHHAHSVEQEVEWLYAFDVHTNAFFCSFFITYVLQYLLLPILLARGAIPCILSNGLYAIATIWYAYITHLGYRGKWYPISMVYIFLLVFINKRYYDDSKSCIITIIMNVFFIWLYSSSVSTEFPSISMVSYRVNWFSTRVFNSLISTWFANQHN